jgi:hypothetical protein
MLARIYIDNFRGFADDPLIVNAPPALQMAVVEMQRIG